MRAVGQCVRTRVCIGTIRTIAVVTFPLESPPGSRTVVITLTRFGATTIMTPARRSVGCSKLKFTLTFTHRFDRIAAHSHTPKANSCDARGPTFGIKIHRNVTNRRYNGGKA